MPRKTADEKPQLHNITFYISEQDRLDHYDKWAKRNGFQAPSGRPNRSALARYALDKITGYKQVKKEK